MRTLLQKTQTEVFPSRTPIPWSSSRIVSLDWTGVSATDPSSLTFQDVNVSPVCAGPPEPDSLLTCQSKMSELGDLRSVVKPSDFYSVRQWHSTSMYSDYHRPHGLEHELQLCLPDSAGLSAGPGRNVRLYLYRGPGPDFSERDRAVLTLLRPHLHQTFLDAERRRHPVPRLTPRQKDLLHLLAAGHTNTQIARRLGISEGTVRTHLENLYGRLNVSSRTAAVTRAFSGKVE